MNFISAKNVALLVAAGLIASTGSAVAADTASLTPTVKVHSPNPDVVAFKAAMAAHRTGHKAANDAMRAARSIAQATRDATINTASTKEAKNAARATFKASIASAKATHDAAIAVLGAKPTPPVKAAK
jgi:hypothetical protein